MFRMDAYRLLCLCCCLILALVHFSAVTAFPLSLDQNPFLAAGGKTPDALVDVTGSSSRDKFLRSFCRYCHSQPFFCGELLELCYARFRI